MSDTQTSMPRIQESPTIKKFKLSLSDQDGVVIELFDSDGYDLRQSVDIRLFLHEIGIAIKNQLMREDRIYVPTPNPRLR